MQELDFQIVDMHCDTISEILKHRRLGEDCLLKSNSLHVDLVRMQKSGYLLQNFALFVQTRKCRTTPWDEVCDLYEVYKQELLANEDILAPVLVYEDIERNKKAGKLSSVLTVEEGAVCGGDINRLKELYDKGVRMMTLSWNYLNELGWPNLNLDEKVDLYTPDTKRGLTPKGREFVEYMNTCGMIVDVSHMSDAGFYDVLECSNKPFVASHSNARAVCGSVRNLTDDMIRRLSERGGCMGLNFCADFLETVPEGDKNPGTISAVVRHAKHIVNVGGIEVLGLGSDFDGIDTHRELPGAHKMRLLWDALHEAGFTQTGLDKIFGGNVLRVYRANW